MRLPWEAIRIAENILDFLEALVEARFMNFTAPLPAAAHRPAPCCSPPPRSLLQPTAPLPAAAHRPAPCSSPPPLWLRRNIAWIILLLLLPDEVVRADAAPTAPRPEYHPSRILVKPAVSSLATLHASLQTRVLRKWPRIGNLEVVHLPQGLTVKQAIAAFQASGQVEYWRICSCRFC
ncbi:MAG: hypothetical protein FJ280_10685 [Planctomycetes bacterium]|nr:hypothetical protein [Planctomycetota bacterium]